MKESTFRTICYVSISFLLLVAVIESIFIFQNNQQIDTIRKELSGSSLSTQTEVQSQMTTEERITSVQSQLNELKVDVVYLKNQANQTSSNIAKLTELQNSVSSLNNRIDQLETKQQRLMKNSSLDQE